VVFSSFAWGLGFIASMGLTIKKQARQLGINQIIAAAVHIGLQMILVPHYGYFACAVSTLIGYTLLFVLQTVTSKPHLTWHFPFGTLRNVTAASAIMGLVAWGIYRLSNVKNAVSIPFLLLSILVAVRFICCACGGWVRSKTARSS
jgi:O-antigen/teichoic acid export membrane protein